MTSKAHWVMGEISWNPGDKLTASFLLSLVPLAHREPCAEGSHLTCQVGSPSAELLLQTRQLGEPCRKVLCQNLSPKQQQQAAYRDTVSHTADLEL